MVETMTPRRFPGPWTAEKIGGGYVVGVANGQPVACVYSRATESDALWVDKRACINSGGAFVGDASCDSGCHQLLGQENHGLAVHHRSVPLAHDLEIRGALGERPAGAPAIGLQEIGR